MPTAFSRSLRSLEADAFRGSVWGLIVLALLLAVGLGWFLFARISLYETTTQARLEVDRASHPVGAPVAGKIIAAHLALGREVQAGDLLLELESEGARLRREEDNARLG